MYKSKTDLINSRLIWNQRTINGLSCIRNKSSWWTKHVELHWCSWLSSVTWSSLRWDSSSHMHRHKRQLRPYIWKRILQYRQRPKVSATRYRVANIISWWCHWAVSSWACYENKLGKLRIARMSSWLSSSAGSGQAAHPLSIPSLRERWVSHRGYPQRGLLAWVCV
jgi:hypothetical protein